MTIKEKQRKFETASQQIAVDLRDAHTEHHGVAIAMFKGYKTC